MRTQDESKGAELRLVSARAEQAAKSYEQEVKLLQDRLNALQNALEGERDASRRSKVDGDALADANRRATEAEEGAEGDAED